MQMVTIVKFCFLGKNKKNISKCRLLKILPRVLSVKSSQFHICLYICCTIGTVYDLQKGTSIKYATSEDPA